MDCQDLQNDSVVASYTDPFISSTSYCLNLPENLFNIEVLDEQNIQILQFEGFA